MKETKNTSIIDVSEKAGVSAMTVSRVIRRDNYVSNSTRAKVMSAIEKLNYIPSHSARALRNGGKVSLSMKTCCGLIFGWETQEADSFFSDIARSAEKEAIEHGLCLLQTHWQRDFEGSWKRLASVFSVSGLCGLILAGQFSVDEVRTMKQHCDNIVIIDGPAPSGANVACVEADYNSGSELALKHLASVGAQKVLVIAGPNKDHYFAKAIQRAAQRYSSKFKVMDIVYSNLNAESGERVIREKFSGDKPYDAVFTGDEVALGALRAFAKQGLKVPDDVKVIGFDNIPYSKYSSPSLSTVHIDKLSLGQEAVKTLIEHFHSSNKKGLIRVKKVIEASLMIRESTVGSK